MFELECQPQAQNLGYPVIILNFWYHLWLKKVDHDLKMATF